MKAMRSKNGQQLDLFERLSAHATDGGGAAVRCSWRGIEVIGINLYTDGQGPAGDAISAPEDEESLMEVICCDANIEEAVKRVRSNRGAPGVDGVTTGQLPGYMRRCWPMIRRQLVQGTYQPQAVRHVEIEKPGGGTRTLGIPTVIDRVIQQAILNVLQPVWDPTFHDASYGFRPGRSAHQAVDLARKYVLEGYAVVVDIDLEKFFDNVNHDVLMNRVARRIDDKRLLRLIRRYLRAGIMADGPASPRSKGTPQGSPLSPLLSNLLLDELDQELGRRGHRFVRYADDCNIYVHSVRAGQRVMSSVEQFLKKRLRLKVNHAKSAVAEVEQRSFLGFRLLRTRTGCLRLIAPKAVKRFRRKVRELTRRHRGRSLPRMISELNSYLRGWRAYFGRSDDRSQLSTLQGWMRRRLRSVHWKQWKTPRRRYSKLRELRLTHSAARWLVRMGDRYWHISRTSALQRVLSIAYFEELGLEALSPGRS
jgi:RNA-directed DNA polymerase